MAIQTVFTNWNASGLDLLVPAWNSCSPNLLAGRDYLGDASGMTENLGCHVDRANRDGGSWSEHAWGSAVDQSSARIGP